MPGPVSRDSYPQDRNAPVVKHFQDVGDQFCPQNEVITKKVFINNNPNPRPDNYKILVYREIGRYLILEIKYLDCTNYEGKKILLYKDCTMKELEAQKLIDPHFSENKNFISPIARFEPTGLGWKLARSLAQNN